MMRKMSALIFLVLLLASAAYAQEAVPGDVILVLRNTSGLELSSENCLSIAQSFAEAHNVRVVRVYDYLSKARGKIMMVVHSDTKDENELLKEMQSCPDVISASLNNIVRLDPVSVQSN